MTKKFPCFSSRLLLPIFQPSRPLSGNALKKKKAFRTPPAHVPTMPSDDEDALRLQRQIRRAVAETCGPAGIRELPAQDETAAYVQLLPCGQQFLEAGYSPPKTTQRTDIRKTSVRCTLGCCCHTASCEAFCEDEEEDEEEEEPQPQLAVKPSASLYFSCAALERHNHS